MKTKRVGALVSETGETMEFLVYAHSFRARLRAWVIIALSILLSSFSIFRILHDDPPRASAVVINHNRHFDYGCFLLKNPVWSGAGAGAQLKSGAQIPLAHIRNPSNLVSMTRFNGTDCALEFQLEPKQDYDNIRIKDIYVEVASYEPKPGYEPIIAAPFGEKNVLYVEIDKPYPNKKKFSVSKIIKTDSTSSDPRNADFIITRARPEVLVVRINARKPGIYRFDCYCEVYCDNNEIQKVRLNEKQAQWLFDGPTLQ
ncbi:hypothetical protein HB364_24135 [Pseudoflavitalea sp. X16]|uniref:hypothetical protein n=1 Tax=Paraflavitalea devenefica TaxID=2716334 RepID=UPI00141DE5CB|nr:hypothetical protein [Paraflavitalea devenefica]NII28194.1 hypothetical protein [Paraflavitalea devenefica]